MSVYLILIELIGRWLVKAKQAIDY